MCVFFKNILHSCADHLNVFKTKRPAFNRDVQHFIPFIFNLHAKHKKKISSNYKHSFSRRHSHSHSISNTRCPNVIVTYKRNEKVNSTSIQY